jgi:hypothetical protein
VGCAFLQSMLLELLHPIPVDLIEMQIIEVRMQPAQVDLLIINASLAGRFHQPFLHRLLPAVSRFLT